MKIVKTHDVFFKEIFSKKEEVQDFIINTFPEKIVTNLDLKSLQFDNTSYVDEQLKTNYSDIVYNCLYKGTTEIKIALLFEHKSKKEKYPHLQLLKYLLKIWETNIKQKENLVPVIPIIFYHGIEEWNSGSFKNYFDDIDENLEQFLPSFDYLISDLSNYSDDEIQNIFQSMILRTSFLLMKNIFQEDAKILQKLFKIFSELRFIIETEKGVRHFESMMLYLFYNTELDISEIIEKVKSISVKGGEIAMTTAQKIEKLGIEKGLQQVALAMISRGDENQAIMAVTNLSLDQIEDLRKIAKHKFAFETE